MLNYSFYNKLLTDPAILAALTRTNNPTLVQGWDEPSPVTMPQPINAPSGGFELVTRGMDPYTPDMELPERRSPDMSPWPDFTPRYGPTLRRPGERQLPPVAPGYGTREYADAAGVTPGVPPGPPIRRPGAASMPQPGSRVKQLGGWKGILGGLLGGAIAGGAIRNIGGGGPIDAMRAMQAGREEARYSDALATHTQRQRQQDLRQLQVDEDNRRLHDAQMENYRAQAEERRAKANSLEAQLDREYEDAVRSGDQARIQAAFNKKQLLKNGPAKSALDSWEQITGAPGWIYNKHTQEAKQIAKVEKENKVDTPEERTRAAAKAVKDMLNLPPGTTDEEALRAAVKLSPEQRSVIQYIGSGTFGAIPRPPAPARGSAPHYIKNDKTGEVTATWLEADGVTQRIVSLGQLASPTADASAAGQFRADLAEAKRQAYLVWQGSLQQLQKEGKITGKPENAFTENKLIYQRANESATNPAFFGDNLEFQRLIGLIGEHLKGFATAEKQIMPAKAPIPGEAEMRAAAEKKMRGATGPSGPTGTPAPTSAPTGPTGPTGAWPKVGNLGTATTLKEAGVDGKTMPGRAGAPQKGGAAPKPPQKVWPRALLREFFEKFKAQGGFQTIDDAEKWLTGQNYIVK